MHSLTQDMRLGILPLLRALTQCLRYAVFFMFLLFMHVLCVLCGGGSRSVHCVLVTMCNGRVLLCLCAHLFSSLYTLVHIRQHTPTPIHPLTRVHKIHHTGVV